MRRSNCIAVKTLEQKMAFLSPVRENYQEFEPVTKGFQLQYNHINGRLYQGNSFDWLESLDDMSVDLVFADPPYNIKKTDWDNF